MSLSLDNDEHVEAVVLLSKASAGRQAVTPEEKLR